MALNDFEKATVFIDLLGGRGLLSHTAKNMRPDAQVVYDDYIKAEERKGFVD